MTKIFDSFPMCQPGEYEPNFFVFQADTCNIWYKQTIINEIRAPFQVAGGRTVSGELKAVVKTEDSEAQHQIDGFVEQYIDFCAASTSLNRVVFWGDSVKEDQVSFPNMSIFYYRGEVARIYINRTNPSILLEFTNSRFSDVQEEPNNLQATADLLSELGHREINLDGVGFLSTSHIRYESGELFRRRDEGMGTNRSINQGDTRLIAKQLGIQECNRAFTFLSDRNGCRGYDIRGCGGYIVTIYNMDGKTPQIQSAPKPMKVISHTSKQIVLRGYPCHVETPFGWEPFSGEDYGVTLDIQQGEIVRCTLHLHDRNVDIKYFK